MSLLSKANEPQDIPVTSRRTQHRKPPGVRKTSRTRSRLMVMHGTTAWTWKTRLGEKHLDLDGSLCRYPALFILTNTPRCEWVSSREPPRRRWKLAVHPEYRLGLAQNVIQNWVAILIILAVVYVAIKVVRKMGHGARITRHLRA